MPHTVACIYILNPPPQVAYSKQEQGCADALIPESKLCKTDDSKVRWTPLTDITGTWIISNFPYIKYMVYIEN